MCNTQYAAIRSTLMHRFWTLLIALTTLLITAGAADEPHETPWWVDFVGQQSTLDGEPLPVGAVVRAYDPTGVLAGKTTVPLAGWYLVSVYGDDPQTPDLDEGAVAGDPIAFTVDGHPAVLLGPEAPVWTASGSRVHVELRACTLAGDFDCDCRVTVGDLMRQTWTSNGDRWEVDLQVVAKGVTRPVGGYGESLSALGLLLPWLGLMALVVVGVVGILWRHMANGR